MEMFVSKDKRNFVDYEVFEHRVEFKVFELEASDDETSGIGFFVLSGTVKWDGCSNWDCSPDGVLLHFCNIDDIKSMHDVMVECYDVASKVMERWDGQRNIGVVG